MRKIKACSLLILYNYLGHVGESVPVQHHRRQATVVICRSMTIPGRGSFLVCSKVCTANVSGHIAPRPFQFRLACGDGEPGRAQCIKSALVLVPHLESLVMTSLSSIDIGLKIVCPNTNPRPKNTKEHVLFHVISIAQIAPQYSLARLCSEIATFPHGESGQDSQAGRIESLVACHRVTVRFQMPLLLRTVSSSCLPVPPFLCRFPGLGGCFCRWNCGSRMNRWEMCQGWHQLDSRSSGQKGLQAYANLKWLSLDFTRQV